LHAVLSVYKYDDACAFCSESDFGLLILESEVKIIEHKCLFVMYLIHLDVHIKEGVQICMYVPRYLSVIIH